MECPECGEPVEGGWDECPACLASLGKYCPECGRAVKANWKKCPACKAGLQTDTDRAAPPPAGPEGGGRAGTAEGRSVVDGDAVIQHSDIRVDQSRQEEHVHYHGKAPGQKEVVTPTGELCPICHRLATREWFFCPRCEKKYLCLEHRDPKTFLCQPCTAKQEQEARALAGTVEPGMVIGERYRIERLLGEGGMGRVFLATDLELEERFALKFLPPELSRDESAMLDLHREMKVAMGLTHENIVRLYNLETLDGHKFLTMEYVDGPTLASMLLEKRKRDEIFPLEELSPLLEQICKALDYIHGKKVVHRDLKPANVMVSSDGVVKVADLGIARVIRDTMSRVSNRPTTGTLAYMSPEQLRGEGGLDGRSDIYSLGCLLYELLSGKPPFSSGDIYHQHLNETPKPIEGVPRHVSEALLRAMAKQPDDRFADAGAFCARLSEGADKQTAPAPDEAAGWFYLDPEWKEELASRVSSERVLVELDDERFVVPGIDGAELIRAGCLRDACSQEGELLGYVDEFAVEALAAAARFRELGQILQPMPAGDDEADLHYLHLLCVRQEPELARQEVLKACEEGPEEVAIISLVTYYDGREEAEGYLDEQCGSTDDTSTIVSYAKIWQMLLGDGDKARECLRKAEAAVSPTEEFTGMEWLECAECWMALHGDRDEAERCLKEAEKCASDSVDWAYCAESRRALFGLEEAQRCLRQAEELAEGAGCWKSCAETWGLFGKDREAERCLEEAEARTREEAEERARREQEGGARREEAAEEVETMPQDDAEQKARTEDDIASEALKGHCTMLVCFCVVSAGWAKYYGTKEESHHLGVFLTLAALSLTIQLLYRQLWFSMLISFFGFLIYRSWRPGDLVDDVPGFLAFLLLMFLPLGLLLSLASHIQKRSRSLCTVDLWDLDRRDGLGCIVASVLFGINLLLLLYLGSG